MFFPVPRGWNGHTCRFFVCFCVEYLIGFEICDCVYIYICMVTSRKWISVVEHSPVNFMVGWIVLQVCRNVWNSIWLSDRRISISSMYLSHSLILLWLSCQVHP